MEGKRNMGGKFSSATVSTQLGDCTASAATCSENLKEGTFSFPLTFVSWGQR